METTQINSFRPVNIDNGPVFLGFLRVHAAMSYAKGLEIPQNEISLHGNHIGSEDLGRGLAL